jgi:hypothetical protein
MESAWIRCLSLVWWRLLFKPGSYIGRIWSDDGRTNSTLYVTTWWYFETWDCVRKDYTTSLRKQYVISINRVVSIIVIKSILLWRDVYRTLQAVILWFHCTCNVINVFYLMTARYTYMERHMRRWNLGFMSYMRIPPCSLLWQPKEEKFSAKMTHLSSCIVNVRHGRTMNVYYTGRGLVSGYMIWCAMKCVTYTLFNNPVWNNAITVKVR